MWNTEGILESVSGIYLILCQCYGKDLYSGEIGLANPSIMKERCKNKLPYHSFESELQVLLCGLSRFILGVPNITPYS